MTALRVMTVSIYRLCYLLAWIIFSLLTPALAQVTTTITPDGSLGTRVNPNGSIYTIDGGTVLGTNQFHSFDRLDVGTGDTANFTGPASVENILSRVTGGAASMIDGTLQSDIAGADLYLLNPSGVMFGPNAELNVMGSFHVSTADLVRLEDGGVFASDLAMESVLSLADPVAFGFLRGNPSGIRIEGSRLAVPTSQMLSIIGDDVEIIGNRVEFFNDPATLAAPSGQLRIVSVASPGEVKSESSGNALSVAIDSFTRLGTITITDAALVDVSSEDGGGTMIIRGGRLMIDNSSIFAQTAGDQDGDSIGINIEVAEGAILTNGSLITTDVFASGDAGDIRVNADKLVVTNSVLGSRALGGSTGNAGTVKVTVQGLAELLNKGEVQSVTFAQGDAGSVEVTAGELRIDGGGTPNQFTGITSSALAGSSGAAGTVKVTVQGSVELLNGATIYSNTSADGNAGHITISASSMIMQESNIFAASRGSGQAGDIDLLVETLHVIGGNINTSGFSSGSAGTINLIATEEIRFTNPGFSNGVFTSLASDGEVSAGRIIISSPVLALDAFAVTASQRAAGGPGGMIVISVDQFTMTGGALLGGSLRGQGSVIDIRATESITISGFGTLPDGTVITTSMTSPGADGNGGQIVIRAPILTLLDGGSILTTSVGSGRGGDIDIKTDRLVLTGGSLISSVAAGAGKGGDVNIVATEGITISGRGTFGEFIFLSNIGTGSVDDGPSGNVKVMAPVITLEDEGNISATTSGPGRGGEILIEANRLLLDNGFINSSTVDGGPGGMIDIRVTESIRLSAGANIIAVATTNPLVNPLAGQIGDAGRIGIHAPEIILESDSGIGTSTDVDADAGTITITTESLLLSEGSRVVSDSTNSSGSAGEIILNIGELSATSSAVVGSSSRERATGKAGTIRIQGFRGEETLARDIHLSNATIETQSTTADGGNIVIHASGQFQLRESRIVAEVRGGVGSGGNITIDGRLGLMESSEIRADAFGGPGGNITIQADGFITDASSVISASSAQSVDGTVSIQGLADLSGTLTPIDPSFATAAALQSDPCIGRLRGEGISRFALAGRDRLPTEPGGLMPSPSGMAAAMAPPARQAAARLSQGQPRLASTLTDRHRDCVR